MLLDFDRLGAWKWALAAISALMSLFLLLPVLFIVALSFGSCSFDEPMRDLAALKLI